MVDAVEAGAEDLGGVEEVGEILQNLRRKPRHLLHHLLQGRQVFGARLVQAHVVMDRQVGDRVLALQEQEEVLALAEVAAEGALLVADAVEQPADLFVGVGDADLVRDLLHWLLLNPKPAIPAIAAGTLAVGLSAIRRAAGAQLRQERKARRESLASADFAVHGYSWSGFTTGPNFSFSANSPFFCSS